MSREIRDDMSERWVEWKIEASWVARDREHAIVALIDGPSGALLGRAIVACVGTSPSNSPSKGRSRKVHVVLSLLNGLLNQKYTIELGEGEEMSPLHFEPLVADVEKVLPGLSGDVITAVFQAINATKTLNARRRSER
jgi:hypothetical protein